MMQLAEATPVECIFLSEKELKLHELKKTKTFIYILPASVHGSHVMLWCYDEQWAWSSVEAVVWQRQLKAIVEPVM